MSDPRMKVIEANTDAEISACFPVMHHLRPHLRAEDFVATVRRMQPGGYRLAAVLDSEGRVRAVAGWRFIEMLVQGLHVYVDDLVTDPQVRSHGFGAALLGWLRERAREAGCATLELDSGTFREEAHRFYFRHRMTISSFHFREKLKDLRNPGA